MNPSSPLRTSLISSMVAVDLAGARAGERGHDDPDARLDGGLVRGQVDGPERGLVEVGHALVDAVPGVVDVPQAVPPSPT